MRGRYLIREQVLRAQLMVHLISTRCRVVTTKDGTVLTSWEQVSNQTQFQRTRKEVELTCVALADASLRRSEESKVYLVFRRPEGRCHIYYLF